jgi:hypothetical protein
MKIVPLASCVAILIMGLAGIASEASARSAGISLRGPAPRTLAPAGNHCLGVRCGLGGPVPPVVRPFVAPRARVFVRRHHLVRRHGVPYGVGFAYGGWPLTSPEYVASVPDSVATQPRGCYSRPYAVPSEDDDTLRTVVVTRCYGM